jgi:hypothetical protein
MRERESSEISEISEFSDVAEGDECVAATPRRGPTDGVIR